MTAGPAEDVTAAATQAAGEAADARHRTDTLAEHAIAGSAMVAEQASTSDDIAVAWTTADTTAQPTLVPSTPRPVNSFERDELDPT